VPSGYVVDTEILTRNGWKLFSKLTDEDEVATRTESGLFEWQQPSGRLEYPSDGEMVEFSSKSVELLVTPSHRMLVKRPDAYTAKHAPRDGETGWHIRLAEHIARAPETRWLYPVTSRWCPATWPAAFVLPGTEADRRHPAHERATEWLAGILTKDWTPAAEVLAAAKLAGISNQAYLAARKNLGVKKKRVGGRNTECWWEMSKPTKEYVPHAGGAYTRTREFCTSIEAFCAFLGIYLAEGWVRADRDDIIVSQSPNSPDLEEIREILAATGLNFIYDARNMKFTASNKPLAAWLRENCGHRAWGKHVPQEFKDLPLHLQETMLHAMMLGDGHWGEEGQRRYTTTSAQLADDVQEILQKLGRDSWVRRETTKDYPGRYGKPDSKHQTYVVRERLGDYHWLPIPRRTEYHGTIYCVTVPNGIVYVRRNGKAIWCGDSTVHHSLG
jgi:LAGLIDADG-like domain